jgi:hypothetical protein
LAAFWVGISGCAALVGADFDAVHPTDDAGDDSADSADTATEDTATEFPDAGNADASRDSSTEPTSDTGDGGSEPDVACSNMGACADAGGDPSNDARDAADSSRPMPDVNAPCASLEACGAYPWGGYSTPYKGFHVYVPYDFDPNLTAQQRDLVAAGMQQWTDATEQTIYFNQATLNDSKFIRFVNSGTCGGAQVSNPNIVEFQAADCSDEGRLLHEIGRVLGLVPTQQRYDRDRYLELAVDVSHECVSADARAQEIAPRCDPLVGPGGDFGVFNFQSVMMSSGFSEAGKTPYCGTPPVGDRTFVRRGVPEDGTMPCKSDVEPNWSATKITPGDASSAIQLYLAAWAGWMQFQSLSRDVDPQAPLDVQLSPGVTIDSNPALASLGGATFRIFVRGSDGNIWDGTGKSVAWENLGTPTAENVPSEPAAASWSEDSSRIDVVTVSNQTVYRRTYDGQWEAWDASMGAPPGGARSAATIASGGPGSLFVCVLGMDAQVWTNQWQGAQWSGWSSLPPLPVGIRGTNSPAATARNATSKHVVVRGTDDALYYLSGSSTWSSSWVQIARSGTAGLGRPTFAQLGPSALFALVRGTEGFMWQVACAGPTCDSEDAWEPPIPLGGVLAGDPALSGLRGATRVDVVITSADGASFPTPSKAQGLWHAFWPRNFQ